MRCPWCGSDDPAVKLRDATIGGESYECPDPFHAPAPASKPYAAAVGRVALWDAINEYAASCGGDPSRNVYGNTRRHEAVVKVEAALAAQPAGDAEKIQQAIASCMICEGETGLRKINESEVRNIMAALAAARKEG